MHLFTQSALLKALGWSLFNSLWQMALLWLAFMLLTVVFKKATAGLRHFLALLLLVAGSGWFLISFIGGIMTTGEQPGYAFPWVVSRTFIDRLLPWCSSLYLLVLIVLFARYSHHYLYSKRLKLTGLTKIQPGLRVFVEETSRRMGIGKEVRVWLSSLVEVPVTLGFLKPVILIPLATVNNLSLQQVETILLHELAHIKRYDYLLNLGVTVLELVFFFNPFSRMLIRDIRREREHRCDDLVMQFPYDPLTYVSALLSLASHGRQLPEIALAATGKNDRLLLRRVKRILKQKNKDDQPGARSLVFLLFTVLLAFIGLARPSHPVIHLPVGRWAILDLDHNKKHRGAGYLELPDPVIINDREGNMADSMPYIAFIKNTKTPHARGHVMPTPPESEQSEERNDEPENIVLANNRVTDDGDEDPGFAEVKDLKLNIAAAVQPEVREYSIRKEPVSVTVSASAYDLGAPFVPNSSFSAGHTDDSVYRVVQLVDAADKAAREEMERGMKMLKTQKDVLIRWRKSELISIKPLRMIARDRRPDINRLEKDLNSDQIRLFQEYQRKQQEALKKLPPAQRKRIIIYI